MLGDYTLSLIRTYVPVAIGGALTWLAVHFGIVLDEGTAAWLVIGAVGLVASAYYTIVRAFERRFPGVGRMLLTLGARGGEPVYGRTARSRARRLPQL